MKIGLASQLTRRQKGASLVEYGILVGLVSVLAIGAVLSLGQRVNETFVTVGDEVRLARLIATAERLIYLPDETIFPAQDCFIGDASAQTITAGSADADGFDCYDMAGGGDLLNIETSAARSIAWYLYNGANTANLPAGNHVILFPTSATSGIDRVTTAGGSSTVAFPGMNLADVTPVVEADRLRILRGSKELNLPEQWAGTSPAAPFTSFVFEDGSYTADQMRQRALDLNSTNGPNTITGSSWDDVIVPLDGFDTVVPFGGDDTIIFSSGNMLIVGGVVQGAGFDTLDMSAIPRAGVTFNNSFGTLVLTVTATGETIQIFQQYGLPDMNINRIIFSDMVLDEPDIAAFE